MCASAPGDRVGHVIVSEPGSVPDPLIFMVMVAAPAPRGIEPLPVTSTSLVHRRRFSFSVQVWEETGSPVVLYMLNRPP